jgi:hypothetical protein
MDPLLGRDLEANETAAVAVKQRGKHTSTTIVMFPQQWKKWGVVNPVHAEELQKENWGNQFNWALLGRLRRDGAIVELTDDKSSARVALKIGPACRKLKNLNC